MEKIRICIGSNDGENIVTSHMGDADLFYIYDLFENTEHTFIEKRINTAKEFKHGKSNKMQEILEILKDTDLLIANQLSPNFKKIAENTKYQPVIVQTKKIEDIFTILTGEFKTLHGYVIKRKNGEFFNIIPELI